MFRLGFSFAYSTISTFEQPAGKYRRALYRPHLVWFLTPRWQIGVAGAFGSAQLVEKGGVASRGVAAAQVFGQYSRTVQAGLDMGARLDIRIPGTAAGSEAGEADSVLTLVPGASTIVPQIILGVPIAQFETALALGYAIDLSSHLLAQSANDEQAASLAVASDNSVILKVGVQRGWEVPHGVQVTPFAEILSVIPNFGPT